MRIVVNAIKRAGSLDHQKIRDSIAATDLSDTRRRIRFDTHDYPTFEIHIVRIENGKEVNARAG